MKERNRQRTKDRLWGGIPVRIILPVFTRGVFIYQGGRIARGVGPRQVIDIAGKMS